MQPCAGEQIQNSLHTLTVVRRRNFAENDAERRLRVENVAVILFMRSYFDNSMKQMLRNRLFPAMISSLSTPFIRLMITVFSPVTAVISSRAPAVAPYLSETIRKSTPYASSGVHTSG